ncbi:MAG: Holliday junction resolvase RuvX [Bacteroidales bacterium]|nr:Holliday junction resolvase RuvX [Bacteroidales bacterium]
MGRILAVDYGEKRIGLAVSDSSKIIATKLDTVANKEIFKYLNDYFTKENVDMIDVGNPKQMNNTTSQSAQGVMAFVKKLSETFPQKDIFMIDERYTSKIASHTIALSGMKKKKRQEKGLIDEVSAVLILQDFMQMYQGTGKNNIICVNKSSNSQE